MKIRRDLKKLASKERAEINQRFFKTGKGEYGYGDIFIGVRVPDIRNLAQSSLDLSREETNQLIRSKIHEERMLGLIILMYKYEQATSTKERQDLYKLYVKNFEYVNNWDLVDVTAPGVIGQHLFDRKRTPLYQWAKSDHLWTRRIAIVSTWWFIKREDLDDTFSLADILLDDHEDLIHKSTGWMLREAGKKDKARLESFLKNNYIRLPRTTLRYAIERFPEEQRQKILKGNFKKT